MKRISLFLLVLILPLSINALEYSLSSNPDTTGNISSISGQLVYIQPLMNGKIEIFTPKSSTPLKTITAQGPFSSDSIIVFDNYLLINNFSKNLLKIDMSGSKVVWSFEMDAISKTTPLYIDSEPGLVVNTLINGKCYGINYETGKKLWEYKEDALIASAPTLFRKGVSEHIAFCTTKGKLVILDKEGKLIDSKEVGESVSTSPALGYLNFDNVPDIILTTDSGKVIALDGTDYSELWNYSTGSSINGSPVSGYFDVDNRSDPLVVTSSGEVIAISAKGTKLWQSSLNIKVSGTPALLYSPGSVNVIVAGDNGEIKVLHGGSGKVIKSLSVQGNVKVSPLAGDLDGDGEIEILISTRSRKGYLLETGFAAISNTELWNSFQGDRDNSGLINYQTPQVISYSEPDRDEGTEDISFSVEDLEGRERTEPVTTTSQPKPQPQPQPQPSEPSDTSSKDNQEEYMELINSARDQIESGKYDQAIKSLNKAIKIKNTPQAQELLDRAKQLKQQSEVIPDF